MNKMFDKNDNHLSAKEICIIFGKDEILSVTAEEYAELERQIEIGKQEHEKVGELHTRLNQALTELEELKEKIRNLAGNHILSKIEEVFGENNSLVNKIDELLNLCKGSEE